MPIPTLITDLSTTAATNSPSGSDNVFPDLDNYLRAQSAFIASIRDNTGNGWVSPYLTVAGPSYTGTLTGSTAVIGQVTSPIVGGGAGASLSLQANGATQALIDTTGNLGIGVTPSSWNGVGPAIQLAGGSIIAPSPTFYATANGYYNGGWKYVSSAAAVQYVQNAAGDHRWYTAPAGTAGAAISFTQAMALDASGNLGLGVTPSALGAGYKAIQIGQYMSAYNSNAGQLGISANSYYNGTNWIYSTTNAAFKYEQDISAQAHKWYIAGSGTAGATVTFAEVMRVDSSGNLLPILQATPPTLAANGQLVFNLTSNTNLRVSVRGTDGVTRTANITLA